MNPKKQRLLFYLDGALGEVCSAISFRAAWESAVFYKAPHALRRDLRRMMRRHAQMAVVLARREATRRDA
jgi:hypothetical protein